MKRLRRSTILPLVLLLYLAVMAWIGRGELAAGRYLYYFGIIGLTLLTIAFLHLVLRQRERRRAELRRRRRLEKQRRESQHSSYDTTQK